MRDGQLVTQPRFSRRILRVSFLSLLSVASAAYNRCHGCALCALLVFCNSVNYWRHPVFGWRRNLDMLVAGFTLMYQLALTAQLLSPAPRAAYLASVGVGVGCYATSRLLSFTYGRKDISSWFHVALHVTANIGNLLLYDALGSNWLGWEVPP